MDGMAVVESAENQGAWEQRRVQVALRIELAGLQLIGERGLDDVTVEQIAKEAGISVRTFFRYFRNTGTSSPRCRCASRNACAARCWFGRPARACSTGSTRWFHAMRREPRPLHRDRRPRTQRRSSAGASIVRDAPDVFASESRALTALTAELDEVVRGPPGLRRRRHREGRCPLGGVRRGHLVRVHTFARRRRPDLSRAGWTRRSTCSGTCTPPRPSDHPASDPLRKFGTVCQPDRARDRRPIGRPGLLDLRRRSRARRRPVDDLGPPARGVTRLRGDRGRRRLGRVDADALRRRPRRVARPRALLEPLRAARVPGSEAHRSRRSRRGARDDPRGARSSGAHEVPPAAHAAVRAAGRGDARADDPVVVRGAHRELRRARSL